MSLVFRRTYLKAKSNLLPSNNNNFVINCPVITTRAYNDDKSENNPQFSTSTLLLENGFNVQELPVAVRKLKDLSEIEDRPDEQPTSNAHDSLNYHLIQEEFKRCHDLRDVFSLLTKCTKITPNIALGAIERIHDIEKNPRTIILEPNTVHINVAKGAILEKLLKVVMKTEDTQTILNILNTVSSFMEPFKHKFHDELLLRVLENKLSVEQLCQFITFLMINKDDNMKYAETIDKLWVGFVVRESEINETNILHIFNILQALKASKRIILSLLEQKLCDLWSKIKVPVMQDILSSFITEQYSSLQSCCVVGGWLSANIHALDDDSLLDIISKLTRLKYTDDQIEKSVEKYMKLKVPKIENPVLVVGILNFSMQFQIYNKQILNACSVYFINNCRKVSPSFLKSIVYPYGYLNFNAEETSQFWDIAQKILQDNFNKICCDDLSSAVLAFIYVGKYPTELVTKMLNPEYLSKVNKHEVMKKLHLIDTAMSLESKGYSGPLLPKDHWSTPVSQDFRIKNILDKIMGTLINVIGGKEKMSLAVSIPYLPSDETYLLDVMVHPAGFGNTIFNWKSQTGRHENIAVLIHLPDHYCSNNEHLIGPQVMKKRHLKILGLKVASLKYSLLSQLYTSYNKNGLKEYILDSINNAEDCLKLI